MSTAVTATPAIDTAIDRAFTDNRLVGAVVLIARDGKIVYRRAEGIGFAVSLRKTISSRKGLCSLPLLTNWNPTLWWRSYYALKILIVWLAPHRMQAAELRELASWTLLRLLAIPSAVIGH
jgi:hypothetical protein